MSAATPQKQATLEFIQALALEAAGGDTGKTLGILTAALLMYALKHEIPAEVMIRVSQDALTQIRVGTAPAGHA